MLFCHHVIIFLGNEWKIQNIKSGIYPPQPVASDKASVPSYAIGRETSCCQPINEDIQGCKSASPGGEGGGSPIMGTQWWSALGCALSSIKSDNTRIFCHPLFRKCKQCENVTCLCSDRCNDEEFMEPEGCVANILSSWENIKNKIK